MTMSRCALRVMSVTRLCLRTPTLRSHLPTKPQFCRSLHDSIRLNSGGMFSGRVLDQRTTFTLDVLAALRPGRPIAVAQRRQYSSGKNNTLLQLDTAERQFTFNSTWLRENCQCHDCFNHTTNQRNILYYSLTPEQTIAQAQRIQGDKIQVTWSDGHVSTYSVDWLQNHTLGGAPEFINKVFWDKYIIADHNPQPVLYDEYMSTDDGLKKLLESLLRYGVGFVSGASADLAGTEHISGRVCHVKETLFGRMWAFTSDLARGDTAYTNIGLGAHTDTTYLQLPAGIQVFHVTFHDGEGGETLLVDGFRAAERMRQNNRKGFDLLKTIAINHFYKEPGHHVGSLAPVLVTHPVTDELINIRYNHYDRSPLTTVPHDQLGEYYDALAELSGYVTDPEGEHWVRLRPGTVLFVDNFRVMHGRSAFTGSRHVCGCYLPREDWVGRARTLGLTP